MVLLDIMLPEMDGFEVLKALRAVMPALPVIMACMWVSPHMPRSTPFSFARAVSSITHLMTIFFKSTGAWAVDVFW